MNTSFMRLLAQRLEHLSWTEVVPDECRIVEHFDSMDGFFMSGDLQFWDRPPGFIFGDEDCFIGQLEDWAVQLIQEQHGYYKDYRDEADREDSWVDAGIDDHFNEHEVWQLACRALGLGKEVGESFVVDEDLAHALLRPSGLYGRMRGVTPRMAVEVLRFCAEGLEPLGAWRIIGEDLRESRLVELADTLEKTEVGVPVSKVAEWTYAELAEKLTHFSMQAPYCPWVTAGDRWCGDMALWACKLFGANSDLWFGPATNENVSMVASTLLGLTVMEGPALFEAKASPVIQGELNAHALRKMLTPEMASKVLRRVAAGVFPSVLWEDCP